MQETTAPRVVALDVVPVSTTGIIKIYVTRVNFGKDLLEKTVASLIF